MAPTLLENLRMSFSQQRQEEYKDIDNDSCYRDEELMDITTTDANYLFAMSSRKYLDTINNYKSISPNPENYNRCIARERYLEIKSAKAIGRLFYYFKDTDLIVDKNFETVKSFNGKTVFIRSSIDVLPSAIEAVEMANGKLLFPKNENKKILEWFKYYKAKRKIEHINMFEFRRNFKKYKGESEQVFVKTVDKKESMIVSNSYEFLPHEDWYDYELIVSEVVNIKSDAYGKLEYRVFVVQGDITSISRYVDYEKHEIPEEVKVSATEIVELMSLLKFPSSYVVDLMIYDNNGEDVIDVVEFNNIYASGRYVQNKI